jgi:hypothetical protein
MANAKKAPRSSKAAIKAGFRRLDELPAAVRNEILAHDEARNGEFALVGDPCAPGRTGPCSITNYPDGTRKVCYCNEAHQCDDCVFEPRNR